MGFCFLFWTRIVCIWRGCFATNGGGAFSIVLGLALGLSTVGAARKLLIGREQVAL
jgi:hypothetical protein